MRPSDVPHLAAHALAVHGLAQKGWRFEWDNARRRAGSCRHHSRTITLSRHYAY